MPIQSDDEALAEAINEFLGRYGFKDDVFAEHLIKYVSDIRGNAYREGYATAQGKRMVAPRKKEKT
jgi:hypothetical protein